MLCGDKYLFADKCVNQKFNMKEIIVKKVNIDDIINEIDDLNQKCLTKRSESIYQDNDARSLIFILLSGYVQNLLLSLTLSKELQEIEFYEKGGYKTENINAAYMDKVVSNYINGASNSFLIFAFVQIENYLRLIAEKYDKIKHTKISITVKNLGKKFNLSADCLNLWKILSNIRNSMHNGGISSYKANIPYKGTQYKFVKNSPINYSSISDILFFINELLDNLISELNEKSSAEDYIEHNYANLTVERED